MTASFVAVEMPIRVSAMIEPFTMPSRSSRLKGVLLFGVRSCRRGEAGSMLFLR
jgi:hypothetical protein